MMKKIIAFLILGLCSLSIISCTYEPNDNIQDTTQDTTQDTIVETKNNSDENETIITEEDTTVSNNTDNVIVPKDKWNGSIAKSYARGSGTESDPYIIETSSQLAFLAKKVNSGATFSGKYFVLNNDLDLDQKEWTPIGNRKYSFAGNFDGNGHTICQLKISKTAEYDTSKGTYGVVGLFGSCQNASISNLKIDNANISVPDTTNCDYIEAGVLSGYFLVKENAQISNIQISNSIVNVMQQHAAIYVSGCIGYISVGNTGYCEMSALQSIANIKCGRSTNDSYSGGIVGYLYNSGITQLSDFACYTSIQWSYKKGANYAGAFGAISNADGRINLSNAFSQITINEKYSSTSNNVSYQTHSIIGVAYASSPNKKYVGTYKFQNLFGCVKPANNMMDFDDYCPLYYCDGLRVTESNCERCTSLPANHGFKTSIWNLSSLSRPTLK